MTTLHRKPSFRRILAGTLAFLLLVGLTSIGHARQKQISPEKAQMIGYVEDFLMNNFRDVTMRKSLEWSDVRTDDKGNRTIRYRFEALIWDKDRKTLCWDFTFNPDGKYVGYQKVEVAEAEKPDPTTQEGIQKLVEKFFSQNYRDITARETIDWGELEPAWDRGARVQVYKVRYQYEATLRDKETIFLCNTVWTFSEDGQFLSVVNVDGFPQKLEKSLITDQKSDAERAADRFLEHLIAGESDKAYDMGDEAFQKAITAQKLGETWILLAKTYGPLVKRLETKRSTSGELSVFDTEYRLQNVTATFRVSVDKENKVAGFFVVKALPVANP